MIMKKNFEESSKGKMTDVEKQVIALKVERLNLEKDRAVMLLNKGMIIYFIFHVFSYKFYVQRKFNII
jgi:hypothetical protein